jgi:glycosyltransferase involved in cell wall biosynthesis
MCVWKRPAYTARVLNALRRCPEISGYELLIHVDGGAPEEVLRIARAVDFCDSEVFIKTRNLGCNGNTRDALRSGFELSDYVVYLEDDILVSRDALTFLEWCRPFGRYPCIWSAGLWEPLKPAPWGWTSRRSPPYPEGYDETAGMALGFHVWGFAIWRDRWEEMDRNWTKGTDRELSWDVQITQNVRGSRCSLESLCCRAINIGDEGGVHGVGCMPSRWVESPGVKISNPPAFRLEDSTKKFLEKI